VVSGTTKYPSVELITYSNAQGGTEQISRISLIRYPKDRLWKNEEEFEKAR